MCPDIMIFFLYGEDIWRKKQKIAQISQKFIKEVDPSRMNLMIISAADAQEDQLGSVLKATPFLARKRMVVLKNCLTGSTRKAIPEKVGEVLPHIAETTILVVSEDSDKPKKWKYTAAREVWEFLEKKATIEEFKPLWGLALTNAIIAEAKKRGLAMKKDAAELLAVWKQADFEQIAIELDKLAAFKGGEPCAIQDVREACSASGETSIFDFLDAVGNKEYKKIMILAEQELQETEPLGLQSRIVAHLRALLIMKLAGTAGTQALKLHPFQAQKISAQVRHWDAPALKRFLFQLLELEYAAKRGLAADPKTQLMALLAKTTGR